MNKIIVTLILLLSIFSKAMANDEKLIVYTYDSFASEWGPGPSVEKSFEKLCKCDLEFIGMDSSIGILGRLKLEGKKSEADIILGLDTNLLAAARDTNLLSDHGADLSKINIPVKWDDEMFLPFDWGHFAFVYDRMKLASPPQSFEELIKSDNNLRIIIQDPRTSTPGLGLLLWVKSIYGEKANIIWEKLSPKIVTVTKGWSEAYGLFLEGEADMVLSYTTSPAYHILVEKDDKFASANFKEGHYLQIEVAAITANTKNPELAKKFMKFILQDEFQNIIPTTNWMFPVTDVQVPDIFNKINQPETTFLYPSIEVEKNRAEWVSEWRKALIK